MAFELFKNDRFAKVDLIDLKNTALGHAKKDLESDIQKVIKSNGSNFNDSRIIIGTVSEFRSLLSQGKKVSDTLMRLNGQWESYGLLIENGNLYILGSDTRGAMWGIYTFCEQYLRIDPMYFWTDIKPEQKDEWVFDEINLFSKEPHFKFRGWFINDEDFLGEWKSWEGRRNCDYKHYNFIIHPQISEKIIETALRLKMNMIILSSFNDVLNPSEAIAINHAAERGMFVTQHHIEPLGVGAFNFDDYFKKQGKEVPLFSFLKNQVEMKMVWEEYVKAWSKYPNVIWQLGLRGRGDFPMWHHDPSVPQDDKTRGKIISEAIHFQYGLVRQYVPQAYMTLTLWTEIADLMHKGFIDIPDDINIIFCDNSPGWVFTSDFYSVRRVPIKKYGIYYHHQLWGSGPHFVQGVPPAQTQKMIAEAIHHGADDYCILNVGNIREFSLGLQATSQMLFDFNNFKTDEFLMKWHQFRYGAFSKQTRIVYDAWFEHFLRSNPVKYKWVQAIHDGAPFLFDGHLFWFGKSAMEDLSRKMAGIEVLKKRRLGYFADDLPEYVLDVQQQKERLVPVLKQADEVAARLGSDEAAFFETDFRIRAKMFFQLMTWVEEACHAVIAEADGDQATCRRHLNAALEAVHLANHQKQGMLKGKWQHWYRGEHKIAFQKIEKNLKLMLTGEVVTFASV